jgi:hypothetical protein
MAGTYPKASDEKKWQAESDLGTLIEAEKIRKDKARHAAAMACRDEKMKAMQALNKDGEKSK